MSNDTGYDAADFHKHIAFIQFKRQNKGSCLGFLFTIIERDQ